jgi:uncharacterized protein (UPF0333 family)
MIILIVTKKIFMKQSLLILAALLALSTSYAQEKEIKKSEKAVEKSATAQDANANDNSKKAARSQRKMAKKQDKANLKAAQGK